MIKIDLNVRFAFITFAAILIAKTRKKHQCATLSMNNSSSTEQWYYLSWVSRKKFSQLETCFLDVCSCLANNMMQWQLGFLQQGIEPNFHVTFSHYRSSQLYSLTLSWTNRQYTIVYLIKAKQEHFVFTEIYCYPYHNCLIFLPLLH